MVLMRAAPRDDAERPPVCNTFSTCATSAQGSHQVFLCHRKRRISESKLFIVSEVAP